MSNSFREEPDGAETRILHLSDPHLRTDVPERTRRLQDVLDLAEVSRYDAIVMTGDVTDQGLPDEYELAARLLTSTGRPWLTVPGNHDDPAVLSRVLGVVTPVLDVGGVRVIGLDVTVPGEDHGLLRDAVAEEAVGHGSGHGRVVFALHHPPVPIGHPQIDRTVLRHPESLAALIRAVPGTAAVLCGHVHTPLFAQFAGVPLVGAPGIASTLRFQPGGPLTDRDALPGYAIHRLAAVFTTTVHHRS